MDKIIKYRQILDTYLKQRTTLRLANSSGAKAHLVIDRENDEYVLLWVGWTGSDYKHSLMFHFQIINGKIWIHENRTDIDLVEVFNDLGVPKKDIEIGFVAPYLREGNAMAA